MRHDTIAARLIVVTRLSAALVFALALGVVEFRSRAAGGRGRGLRPPFRSGVRQPHRDDAGPGRQGGGGTARAIEAGDLGADDMKTLLKRSVEGNPEIFGTAIAFEPVPPGATTPSTSIAAATASSS